MNMLKPLPAQARDEIHTWGHYPEIFRDLDYAIQPGGWLDTIANKATCHAFGYYAPDLVGLSLLDVFEGKQAEFYIAIKPSCLNKGYGKKFMLATINKGFELGFEKLFLKVRLNHQVGIALYQKLGFETQKTVEMEINGEPTPFYLMELTKTAFQDGSTR